MQVFNSFQEMQASQTACQSVMSVFNETTYKIMHGDKVLDEFGTPEGMMDESVAADGFAESRAEKVLAESGLQFVTLERYTDGQLNWEVDYDAGDE